jgi:hypothetical protein
MNREAADHRILKLRNEISNREFDRLYRELRDLQERFSELRPQRQRVGIGTAATGSSGAWAWASIPSSRRSRATMRSAARPSP